MQADYPSGSSVRMQDLTRRTAAAKCRIRAKMESFAPSPAALADSANNSETEPLRRRRSCSPLPEVPPLPSCRDLNSASDHTEYHHAPRSCTHGHMHRTQRETPIPADRGSARPARMAFRPPGRTQAGHGGAGVTVRADSPSGYGSTPGGLSGVSPAETPLIPPEGHG